MDKQIREKNFIKNTIILAFGTFLPKLASFVTLPIYTACLSKSEYGTYDLITVLCSLLLPVATIQIQSSAFRFLLEEKNNYKKSKAIITTLYSFVIPVSVVGLGIYFIVVYQLGLMLKILIVMYYFADILLLVTRQVARGLSMNQRYSVSAVINSFLNMGLVLIFLVIFKTGLNGLMISLTASAIVSLLYLIVSMKIWHYFDFNLLEKNLFKEMIQYAWPMVPNSMSLWVMRVSDRALISLFMGVEANAIYAVANKIPTLLQLAQNTFSMAWSESASLTVNDSDADSYYSRMFKAIHRILAGCAALLMAGLPILFRLLIKGSYDDAYIHIPILVIAMFYSSIAIYLGGLYVANKKTKSIGITTIFAAIINFIINLLFIQRIGIFAASLSTAISYFILMVYRMIDVRKFQKITYSYIEIIISNIILIIMLCLCSQRNLLFYSINFVIGVTTCFILNQKLLWEICKKIKKRVNKNGR